MTHCEFDHRVAYVPPLSRLLPQSKKGEAATLLNVLYVRCIKQCQMSEDVKYACMHGQALYATAHHTLLLNWGNWLNREQIVQLVNSAWRIPRSE